MRPTVAAALADFAGKLRRDIVPQLAGFNASNAGMMAEMLDMAAEQWDTAADKLIGENVRLRDVVRRGAVMFPHVVNALPPQAGDWRVSSLQAENEALREMLIAVHVAVELAHDDEAARLEADIWAILRDGVEARRIVSANF